MSIQLALLLIKFCYRCRYNTKILSLTGPDIIRAQNAPIVDTSKNNDSNKNDACAYVCPNPAKRRRVSFLHIGWSVFRHII